MPAGLFVVTGCLLALTLHSAAAALTLESTPSTFLEGLTTSLTINCSLYNMGGPSNISNLVSLAISSSVAEVNATQSFTELVSANSFSPNQANLAPPVNAKAQASVVVRGQSFLSLTWTDPTAALAGQYRCEAHGIDDFGHTVDIVQSTQVTATQAGTDSTALISALRSALTRVDALEKRLDNLSKVTAMTFGVSVVREVYKGSEYLLSDIPHANDLQAALLCGLAGGYLLEIDSETELDFLIDFLNRTATTEITRVLTGGCDWAGQGNFEWRHSRFPVTLTQWSSGFPNPILEWRCVVLDRDSGWWMKNTVCYLQPANGFVCEIPLN